MLVMRIAVRPMHDAPAFVPHIFAAELERCARRQLRDARCKIDIVCD